MRGNLSRNLLKGPGFTLLLATALGGSLILVRLAAAAAASSCGGLPSHAALKSILQTVVAGGNNGGLGNDMWATVVNRDGVVCAVVFTGADRGSQ